MSRSFTGGFFAVVALLFVGCATKISESLTLMPTPVLYEEDGLEPFSHVADAMRTPLTNVFYATNRAHQGHNSSKPYGNGFEDELHLGRAAVRIGERGFSWDDVVRVSLFNTSESYVPVFLEDLNHWGSLTHRASDDMVNWEEESHRQFIAEINAELEHHPQKEVMLYIHGTKTPFDLAVAMAGEIDHFAGKDFVGVVFAWPAHHNILYYVSRYDVRRAQHSGEALRDLIRLLAEETVAERINLLCWSAGGRVVSTALHDLRERHPELDGQALKERYRIGSVVFAAADVEIDRFLKRLPAASEIAQEVVITVTDDDVALKAGKKFMGGPARMGMIEAEEAEIELIRSEHLDNVEIVDVSRGQDRRGFDIKGHHYWYRHPWSSSDIILLMRTDLGPAERGLSPTEIDGVWYLDPDYPNKVRTAARSELGDSW